MDLMITDIVVKDIWGNKEAHSGETTENKNKSKTKPKIREAMISAK